MINWDNWDQEWYLVPSDNWHDYFTVRTLLLVRVVVDVIWDEPEIPFLNRTIQSYKDAFCNIYGIDVSPRRDLRGVEWQPINDLGHLSIFLGYSYPRLLKISPVHTGDDGGTFIKPGCVFLTSSRNSIFEKVSLPEICHFQLDGTPMWGCELNPNMDYWKSRESASVCIVPSLQNFEDWTNRDQDA